MGWGTGTRSLHDIHLTWKWRVVVYLFGPMFLRTEHAV